MKKNRQDKIPENIFAIFPGKLEKGCPIPDTTDLTVIYYI